MSNLRHHNHTVMYGNNIREVAAFFISAIDRESANWTDVDKVLPGPISIGLSPRYTGLRYLTPV